MSRKQIVSLLSSSACFACPVFASSGTYHVGPGQTYSSIQAAIDAAVATDSTNGADNAHYSGLEGGTISGQPLASSVQVIIHGGIYTEQVDIPGDPFGQTVRTVNDNWQVKAAPGERVILNGKFSIGNGRDYGGFDGIDIFQSASTGSAYSFGSTARGWNVKNGIIASDGTNANAGVTGSLNYGATILSHMTLYNTNYGVSANYAAWGGISDSIVYGTTNIGVTSGNSYPATPSPFTYGNTMFFANGTDTSGVVVDQGGNLYTDPLFYSVDPNSPYFLFLTAASPAATGGIGGTYMGARPVFTPNQNQWSLDGDGIWNDPGNWSVSVPNAVGATAMFTSAISAPRIVTVDAPVTVGHVLFDNATNSYTVAGSSTLTLEVSSGIADITLFNGNHSITAPLSIVSNTDIVGPGVLTAGNITNAGALSIKTNVLTGNLDGAGSTTVDAGKSLSAARIRQSSLVLNGSAAITSARSTTNTSSVLSLTLGGSGKLDLGSNDLVIDYTGGTPFTTVKNAITSGFAGGAWNGATGITSSSAAAAQFSAHPTGLGYGEASVLGIGSFSGQTLTGDAVVVRYTYLGDGNLDGNVDSLDFTRLVNGYGQSSAVWTQGDFNFDGKVNTLDFNSLAGNFGQVLASPSLGAVVPEPASIGLVSAFVAGLLSRRRRGC